MSLLPDPLFDVPEMTAKIAKAAFPKGNDYIRMRDEWGVFYDSRQFTELFSHTGQPAIAPSRLALITIMQFAENLTDRQAADAVRARIDWKYALALDMEDAGFHYSVLSEFRSRLIEGQKEELLFNTMLDCFKKKGLVKARGKQRTDSTRILASIRAINRLELVGETLHYALNVLAEVVPSWLKNQVTPEWYKRYGQRIDNARLPDDEKDRKELALVIGRDGYHLLEQIDDAPESLSHLKQLPVVKTLRLVWLQQYCVQDGQVVWRLRHKHGMAPAAKTIISPYDLEARYGQKRGNGWSGYKVHLTETCDDEDIRLITHVETTSAAVPDNKVVETIHESLSQKALLPEIHLVDMGYPDGENILETQNNYQVDLYGPVRPDNGWQARENTGYDASQFKIDWDIPTATCPQGAQSYRGKAGFDLSKRPLVKFVFREVDCRACTHKALCTRGKSRSLNLLHKEQHQSLVKARLRQKTEEFKEIYRRRAGIEGTISQAVYALTMRRSRYRGQAKTHLHHLATATAMNLMRAVDWLDGKPLAPTRISRFARLAPA